MPRISTTTQYREGTPKLRSKLMVPPIELMRKISTTFCGHNDRKNKGISKTPDQPGGHGGFPDDESTDDPDGRPDRPWQPYAGFPQDFDGGFHEQDFYQRRKGDRRTSGSHGNYQTGGNHHF